METMEDYKAELEASFKRVQEGDVMTGTVIGISETAITLDLKYYAEGIIRLEDFTEDPGFNLNEDVHIGDEITATVIRTDDGQGNILLSRKEAAAQLAWGALTEMMEQGTVLTLKISGIVNGGVIVYVEGIRGFIPASRLTLTYVEDLNDWLHKEVKAQIITVDESKQKLVLSCKELLQAARLEEKKAMVSNLEIGLVTEGTVESIKPYGAFVALDNGLSGLLHISQISEKRIKSPAAVLSVGDKVKVKIIKLDDGKISLSMKALQDVAAKEIEEETIDLPKAESISTNLGDLLKNLKF